jgi:hypothetical protein
VRGTQYHALLRIREGVAKNSIWKSGGYKHEEHNTQVLRFFLIKHQSSFFNPEKKPKKTTSMQVIQGQQALSPPKTTPSSISEVREQSSAQILSSKEQISNQDKQPQIVSLNSEYVNQLINNNLNNRTAVALPQTMASKTTTTTAAAITEESMDPQASSNFPVITSSTAATPSTADNPSTNITANTPSPKEKSAETTNNSRETQQSQPTTSTSHLIHANTEKYKQQQQNPSTPPAQDVKKMIESMKEFIQDIRSQLMTRILVVKNAIEERKRLKLVLHAQSIKLEEEMRQLNAKYKETREELQRVAAEIQETETLWDSLNKEYQLDSSLPSRGTAAADSRDSMTINHMLRQLIPPLYASMNTANHSLIRIPVVPPQMPTATSTPTTAAVSATSQQPPPPPPPVHSFLESNVDKEKKRTRVIQHGNQAAKRRRVKEATANVSSVSQTTNTESTQNDIPPLISLKKGNIEINDLWTHHEIETRHTERELNLILNSTLKDVFHNKYPKNTSILIITDPQEIKELKERYPEKSTFLENEPGKCMLISNDYYQFTLQRFTK